MPCYGSDRLGKEPLGGGGGEGEGGGVGAGWLEAVARSLGTES